MTELSKRRNLRTSQSQNKSSKNPWNKMIQTNKSYSNQLHSLRSWHRVCTTLKSSSLVLPRNLQIKWMIKCKTYLKCRANDIKTKSLALWTRRTFFTLLFFIAMAFLSFLPVWDSFYFPPQKNKKMFNSQCIFQISKPNGRIQLKTL